MLSMITPLKNLKIDVYLMLLGHGVPMAASNSEGAISDESRCWLRSGWWTNEKALPFYGSIIYFFELSVGDYR